MRAFVVISLVMLPFIITQPCAFAEGIQLGRTRVIYDASKKEAALPIINDEKELPWLIQSWASNSDGKTRAPFIITPPLFRLDPKSEQSLRIMWTGASQPEQKEILYYIDVRMIPGADKENADKNVLRIIYKTRIKLFYRAKGLSGSPESTCQDLRFNRSGDQLQVVNSGNFYSVFDSLYLGSTKVKNADMVAPKSSAIMSLTKPASGQTVSWRCINDYGGASQKYTATLNKA